MEGTGTQTLESIVTSLDFSVLQDNVLMVIGASAATIFGIIAIKKGWAFLKAQIYGA